MTPVILDKKQFWKGKFLESLQITYKNSKGEIIPWEAFGRIGCNGIVAIVPFTKDGYTLLTKQFRPPIERFIIEFPAGLNDQDEPLEEVAKRELLEETGYRAESVDEIAIGPLSAGASTEVLTVFVADNVVSMGSQKLDITEEIEVLKVSAGNFYSELNRLLNEKTYVDLKVYGLFELAIRHVKLKDGSSLT